MIEFKQVRQPQKQQDLINSGTTCFIIFPHTAHSNEAFFFHLAQRGIHPIFVDRLPASLDGHLVCSDNFQGGYLAGLHLLRCGCRKPAVLSIQNIQLYSLSQRISGFQLALRECQMELPLQNICMTSQQTLRKQLEQLLQQPVPIDGLFCLNDVVPRKSTNCGAPQNG